MKKIKRISPKLKRYTFLGVLVAILLAFIYVLFRLAPRSKIERMFYEFERRRNGRRGFEKSGISIDTREILDAGFQHFFAVFTYEENAENPYGVTLVGSSNDRFDIGAIANDDTSRGHENLVSHLRENGIPLGLEDYPLAIKIGEDRLQLLRENTDCMAFLLFPCIEEGWEYDDGVPELRQTHLTVGILGSHRNDAFRINELHYRGVDGEETWPYEDFVWLRE